MKRTLLAALVGLSSFGSFAQQPHHYDLVVGTYTNACASEGIYVFDFDTQNFEAKLKSHTQKVQNPSYLTVSADKKRIYATNENGAESYVSAFSLDNTQIKFLNKVAAEGADPCHIINDEKNVIVANYTGGSIAVFEKTKTGKLKTAKQIVRHKGKGHNPKRQESAHVHMVHFSQDHQYLLVNDLGLDKIYVYRYNPDGGTQTLTFAQAYDLKAGSGPRHLAMSPDGKTIYLLQELDGSLSVLHFENGQLSLVQETNMLAADFSGEISAADIHLSADGRYLYATNRGAGNSIATFKVNPANGQITKINEQKTGGNWPRNFTFSPDENLILVAHQYSNDIIIFKRDKETGLLEPTNKKIELCSPVCLVFVEQ
ncbi:6-phosphogluconolactonase [Flexibacter flexilis DSM 6793]|uniref:6-phosphogluconolactonase n=1 Tax=Flexibacter flexilis DSM 6793 TaxID=927664 RepID=A0A1I1GN96_9BACT|nr:lactonase family protein [Flexibacter flexilis]SFC12946.1 6-phosphogluconolactonase [Flexibacter flexilis DSM 6793]